LNNHLLPILKLLELQNSHVELLSTFMENSKLPDKFPMKIGISQALIFPKISSIFPLVEVSLSHMFWTQMQIGNLFSLNQPVLGITGTSTPTVYSCQLEPWLLTPPVDFNAVTVQEFAVQCRADLYAQKGTK